MQTRDFIPPILFKIAKRALGVLGLSGARLYSSYADAVQACGQSIFMEEEYAKVITYKTKLFREALFARDRIILEASSLLAVAGVLLAMQRNQGKSLQVIDLGGASGTHYFVIKHILKDLLPSDLKIMWYVVETQATVLASRDLENDELRFFTDIAQAKEALEHVDLVHSSSALQCLPDPRSTLEQLIECGADYIYLGRIGLTLEKTDVIALHKANLKLAGPEPLPLPPGVANRFYRTPFTFIPSEAFQQALNRKYRIMMQVRDSNGIFEVAGRSIVGVSVLAKQSQETKLGSLGQRNA